jgi:lysine 2,3-aminomutase
MSVSSRKTLRSVRDLTEARLLPQAVSESIQAVAARYAIAITPEMVELCATTGADGAIGRQFVPTRAELDHLPEERADPIGDEVFAPIKGIVHRYPDRALLKPSYVCPVYCRFCFRRESVGPGADHLTEAELAAALDYVRSRPEIWEVVITGGDPLVLSPRRLATLVRALDAIPHLGVIRFHTRVPLVDPGRVTPELLAALDAEKAVFVVLHSNHPDELTPTGEAACRAIVKSGIPMLSQTVLLKGINDDAEVLARLLRGLVALRIKPYYLHHGDLAPGTAGFRTTIETGQEILRRLRGRISGLCQPSYVLDLPGGHGKMPIGPVYARNAGAGWEVEDYQGVRHAYPPVSAGTTEGE